MITPLTGISSFVFNNKNPLQKVLLDRQSYVVSSYHLFVFTNPTQVNISLTQVAFIPDKK